MKEQIAVEVFRRDFSTPMEEYLRDACDCRVINISPPPHVKSALVHSSLWNAPFPTTGQIQWGNLIKNGDNHVWRASFQCEHQAKSDIIIKVIKGQSSCSINQAINNQRLASYAGLATPVLDSDPSKGILICPFVVGNTLKAADLENSALLPQAVKALRQLHDIPSDFDYQHQYLMKQQDREKEAFGFMNQATQDKLGKLTAIIGTAVNLLQANKVDARPCHSDVVTHNILLTEDKNIIFLDWEVSGMGDPHEDLANFIWSASLRPTDLEVALSCYFEEPDLTARARTLLYLMVIPYDWVMRHQIAAQDKTLSSDEVAYLRGKQGKRLKEAVQLSNSRIVQNAMKHLQNSVS